MSYTQTKNIWIRLPWSNSGTDWNGDHTGMGVDSLNLPRSRTGDRNPKWREQVKAGVNAGTPMSGYVDDAVGTNGYVLYKTAVTPGGFKYTLRSSGPLALHYASKYPFDWIASSTSTAYNRALTSYLKNVNRVNQSFQGLTFLGEARETLRMLRNPAEGLRNILGSYINDVKKSKKRFPKNWKKNLSSAWLEYAYGVAPLVHDIQDIGKTYNQLFELPTMIPVEGYSGKVEVPVPSRSFSNLIAPVPFGGGANAAYFPKTSVSRKTTDVSKVKFRGMVRRDNHATLAGAAVLTGFDPFQFIPTAWELLPWSFLIDYFTNIGDILETSVVSRANIAWTNVSTVVEQTSEFYCTVAPKDVQQGSDVEVDSQATTARRTRRTVTRSQPTTLGIPTLQFELPGKPAQWANMLALFTQASLGIQPQIMRGR